MMEKQFYNPITQLTVTEKIAIKGGMLCDCTCVLSSVSVIDLSSGAVSKATSSRIGLVHSPDRCLAQCRGAYRDNFRIANIDYFCVPTFKVITPIEC